MKETFPLKAKRERMTYIEGIIRRLGVIDTDEMYGILQVEIGLSAFKAKEYVLALKNAGVITIETNKIKYTGNFFSDRKFNKEGEVLNNESDSHQESEVRI
jgi:hypothetical protein